MTKRGSELADEVAKLNQIIENKEAELKAQILENSVLSKKVDKLEEAAKTILTIEGTGLFGKLVQLAKVSTRPLNLDLYRKNVDYEYELCDFDAFPKSKVYRYSDFFFAGGVAWYLVVKPDNKDGIEYLSIYLHAKDYAGGDGGYWHVKVNYSLSIVNQSIDFWSFANQKKTYSSTSDFGGSRGWGYPYFISIKDLRDNGYIKDNKIRVQACLKVVGDLIRTN